MSSAPAAAARAATAPSALTHVTALLRDLSAGTVLPQSPYLYIQAAGSDGSDGSAPGAHLRWTLLRGLGDNHLPKGNLAAGTGAPYPAPYGFNKPNDFVTVLALPYGTTYPCTVNFNTDRPASVVETGAQRVWKFDTVVVATGQHREVVLRFDDVVQYTAIRTNINPLTSPGEFLARFTGVVEAEVTNQLCFALSIVAVAAAVDPPIKTPPVHEPPPVPVATSTRPGAPAATSPVINLLPGTRGSALRVEAISVPENLPGADLFISCRKRFDLSKSSATATSRICAENTKYFRFDFTGPAPGALQLETYEQFLSASLAQKGAAWQLIGDQFALSIQDSDVYARLEDPPSAVLTHKWPRYVGVEPLGAFTFNSVNYSAKWDPTRAPSHEPTDDNGLRKGVIRYLALSMSATNPTAVASLPAQDPTDGAAFDISYLQMLNLVGLDFHVARMLGLGCLTRPRISGVEQPKFVYFAIYRTLAALEPGGSTTARTHVCMSLPTGQSDYRLPPAPVQDAPTFGIAFDNGTGTPMQLTDANGYTPFDDSRIVNLHVEPYDTVQPFGPFFVPATEFCSSDVTKPVFYGFKYKLASEPAWRKPELSNDLEFPDLGGVAEVVPLLPQLSTVAGAPNPPIYSQEEREAGIHRYAFYGVNWFARPSALGNTQDVNTVFPQRNTLLPPANLAVQLIQPEDPLILTTATEQAKLTALGSGDSTLVRATFEWNQNHYIPQKFSNAYADKIQFFFRQEPPRAVQGVIKSVTSLSATLVEVRTQPYTIASVSPQQTINPIVVSGDEPRFVGSSFASGDVLYVVDSVAQSTVAGEGALFHVRKQSQTAVVDLNNNNQQSATVQITVPSAGDRFLSIENLNEPANWGANQPLVKQVALVNFLNGSQLYTETVLNPDGTQTVLNIGGIKQSATVTELPDITIINGNPVPIPGSKTGIFDIVSPSYQLANHPDPLVEWYKGTVRIREAAANGKMKVLAVWSIAATGPTLKLRVYDPTFSVDGAYVPLAGYSPIQTGSGVAVNFHPGYRCYFKAQAGVLTQATTLPGAADSAKQTLFAARARNTTIPIASDLTTPVVMQARKISPPVQPDLPIGPLYATRPNFYGKSTWTMDVKVTVNATRQPYGLVLYRANERAVLDTLYKAATADAIEAALKALPATDAAFDDNRWNDLLNVANLDADLGFHQYIPGGYRFPIPDNGPFLDTHGNLIPGYIIPGTTIQPFDGVRRPGDTSVTFNINGQTVAMPDVVKGAIEGIFLPLTETPVIYQFIKSGAQTSSKKPVVRNANGDLLAFTDPAFDPSPMAVKYVTSNGDTHVRFTDYTLDGAAKNAYFYYAAELSDQMKFSSRSPMAGPIHLVNAYPAEAPAIRTVTSVLKDNVLQIPTGVKLRMNAYIESEGITKFNLYRANNAVDAGSPRTMKLVRAYDAVLGAETELFDDFSDVAFPPFGDPLFYRVTALRSIVNEFGAAELIPSQPSALARASIVDVDNPVAPPLAFTSDPPTLSIPAQVTGVVLSWPAATYNATYYLYKQDVSGNWTRIYTERTNADPIVVPLSATSLGTDVLLKTDANGNPIRHSFKLEVENTSGLFSLNKDLLNVPATCAEGHAFFDAVVNFSDNFQPASPLSDRLCDPTITNFPGSMTFQDITTGLPTAHVFDHIEVTVGDGLNHAARMTIATKGGFVTFQNGAGSGLVLDGSTPNVSYAVRVAVFTDSCQDGMTFAYTLHYGPEVALIGLASVLSYADSQTTTSLLTDFSAASAFPTAMTFADITTLPAGHTFVKIDIQVEDDAGGSFSRTINAAGGSVTFNQGDGGLTLDASAPNRTYLVSARLFTNLSQSGVLFDYDISYA